MTFWNIAVLSGFGIWGATAGALHFALLNRHAQTLVAGNGNSRVAALTLLRIPITGGALAFASLYGAGALLTAFAGFLAARAVATRTLGYRRR